MNHADSDFRTSHLNFHGASSRQQPFEVSLQGVLEAGIHYSISEDVKVLNAMPSDVAESSDTFPRFGAVRRTHAKSVTHL